MSIERDINQIAEALRKNNINVSQLQTLLTTLQGDLSSLKQRNSKEEEFSRVKFGELQNKISELDKWNTVIKDLDDIPGTRTPRWYEVDVDFSYQDSQLRFNSAEISPDGPFIITQVQPYWTITDTDVTRFTGGGAAPTGRLLPCTAFPMVVSNFGSTNTNPTIGPVFQSLVGGLSDIPEFSFQIEIAGSGRFWTNRAIPAAAFYGESQPLYTGIAGWVERTDRIVVHCTPEVAIPHNGRVRMVFHGYQILGHVNIGEALGY